MSLTLGHLQWGGQAGSQFEASAISRSATSDLFREIAFPITTSTRSSRALSSTSRLHAAADRIELLSATSQNWDSYGTSRPSNHAIAKAVTLLHYWQVVNLEPELILPSAEGGVALDVGGPNGRRALLEVLDSGVSHIVLYDDVSYCRTLPLVDDSAQLRASFDCMSSYIRRGPDCSGNS